MIKCTKCGSEIIELRKDARGLPVAYCSECDTRIKNMSTAEVIEYYEKQIDDLKEAGTFFTDPKVLEEEINDKPKCKYCLETYVMRQGRLGNIYANVDVNYCPVCGRKRKPDDFNFSKL